MQKRAMLVILGVFLIIGTLLTYNSKLPVDSRSNVNSNRFEWNDNWDNNSNLKPINSAPRNQIIANSYQEAIKMSGEMGMPVLVIFSGDSCQYCAKMKREVLSNQQVKGMMTNYIYVMVNTDDRAGQRVASKYNLKYIPAFAITNYKEDKLRFEERYMGVEQFSKWLNNPNMYNQPKKPQEQEPEPEPEPEPETPLPGPSENWRPG